MFQHIIEDLREATGASRTTLRLDRPDADFPVVAESVAPGERSIAGETSIAQGSAALAQKMRRQLQLIVQDDCLKADTRPPQGLLDVYGVKAQMLHPIQQDGE